MKILNNKIITCVLIVILLIINLFSSILNVNATDDIFRDYKKSELIPYVYENSIVSKNLNSLVERTENLKTNYSKTEAIEILGEIRKNIENITSIDYQNNYNIKHDPNNYETGEFYKYKQGPVEWIVRNIIHLITTNSPNDEVLLKTMIDIIYESAIIEMQNKCETYSLMNMIGELHRIDDRFPSSMNEYLDYITKISNDTRVEYDDGIIPEEIVTPSEDYDEYLEEKNKDDLEGIEQGDFIEEPEENYDEDMDEIKDNNDSSIIIDENDKYDPDKYKDFTSNSINNYLSQLEQIKNNSHVDTKTYEVKNIYYTLDKSADNIEWINSGITLSEDNEVSYSKLMNLLSSISNNIDNSYLIEDIDMSMFITEGKNIVLNKVDKIKEDELNTLFDDFEKLGIKVMIKSDEIINTSNSLTTKVEKGEITSILVNGTNLILTNKPILTKNIVQLPLKQVAQELGYKVSINGKTVTLVYETINKVEKPNTEIIEDETNIEETTSKVEYEEIVVKTEIVLTIGSNNYTIDGKKNSFKTNVTSKNNIVYCEFDKIASIAGYDYSYNAEKGILEFTK